MNVVVEFPGASDASLPIIKSPAVISPYPFNIESVNFIVSVTSKVLPLPPIEESLLITNVPFVIFAFIALKLFVTVIVAAPVLSNVPISTISFNVTSPSSS